MPSPKEVTFVIPVYNLKINRLNNLKFIIPYIQKTGCRILVVEQIDSDVSELTNFLDQFEGVEHILFKTPEKRFHKTGIINYAVFNHVTTKYVWVNDVDFYMQFEKVFQIYWTSDFIQPYEIAKKLNQLDSKKILSGGKLNVEFSDNTVKYISLYGALSFIFNTNSFIAIGAMDESIYDWGYEDVELAKRVNSKYSVQTISIKGIHLWHPINPYINWEEHALTVASEGVIEKKFDINTYFDKIYCINLPSRADRWEQVNKQFLENNIIVKKLTAVSESEITDEQFRKANPNNITGNNASIIGIVENKRALGCLFSHLKVIEDAKKNGYKKILIFEDDIFIGKNFHDQLKLIEKIKWKILYLGASQFVWSNIDFTEQFYLAKNTCGTFAYAVSEDAYDDIIKYFSSTRKSADNLLIELQQKWKNECFVFYPNIVISNVGDSDIRGGLDMNTYAEVSRWDLKNFNLKKSGKKKILLIPDVPGWAFDNIAKAIIKYNPVPDIIEYSIIYGSTLHSEEAKINNAEWDLIYVMWEGERMVNMDKNVVRGCYSAIWEEHSSYTKQNIADYFSNGGGVIFANEELKNNISDKLEDGITTQIIYDSADAEKFYPIKNAKNEEFTAIFVGNISRPIKNFPTIEWICEQADVKLKVINNTPHDQLVYEYCQADICINFSDFEGGPQTFPESSLCATPMLIRSSNQLAKHIPCFTGETKEDFVRILKHLKNNREECSLKGQEAYNVAINRFTYKIAARKFTDTFLRVIKKDYRDKLTVFVISSGENPNYEDCIQAIKNQNCTFRLEEIKNVAPMSKAFQRMIDNCVTPYYVQVDEDMILEENAIEKLYLAIKKSNRNICMVAFMLKDHHLNFNICGIKAYKHYIMVKYPYNLEIISCEKEQLSRLEKDNIKTKTFGDVIGIHSPKWTNQLIYERYFDLMEKWKIYKYDWLNELPSKLLKILKENPTDENVYALIGALISISKTEPIRKREKNFLIEDEAYLNIKKMMETKL